jgi:hypothetical protein
MENQPNDNNPHLLSPNKRHIASNDQQDAHMNAAEAPEPMNSNGNHQQLQMH